MREHESKVKYEHVGEKDDLMIVGIVNASLKSGYKAVGGVMLFLTNSPVYWKAKQIESAIVPKMQRL